jgi:MoaA/NifB/PqqE/SkfB family radical SAM enzyme
MSFLREHSFLIREWPGLLPRLARSYFRLLALRLPVLRGVEFAVTYRCESSCPHCLRLSLIDPNRPELAPEEIAGAVEDLLWLGALNINLTGGEPLLREDLMEVIAAAQPRRCFLTLATSGGALTLAKAVQLRRAGIRMLSISIDDPGEQEHDRKRCTAGSYRRAMRALGIASEAGLKVSVCCILTRDLIEGGRIIELIDMLQGKVQQITLNLPYRVGGWAESEHVLSEDDLRVFRRLVSRPFVRWQGSSGYMGEGCPAGGEKIYITPYGDVLPCACIHATYGNLRQRPLRDIYAEMRRTPIFRKGTHRLCLVAEDPVFSTQYIDTLNALCRKNPWGFEGRELLERIPPSEIS